MSATRDLRGISSIGIQSIMPTTDASRRPAKRKPADDRDTDNARTESRTESQTESQTECNVASPSPRPPGTGSLVDKAV
jgi:hypothetical protein